MSLSKILLKYLTSCKFSKIIEKFNYFIAQKYNYNI